MAKFSIEDKTLTNIADKLRSRADTSYKITPEGMPAEIDYVCDREYSIGYSDGYPKGYDAGEEDGYTDGHHDGYNLGYAEGIIRGNQDGKKAQYDAYWDIKQNYGNRKDWRYAFLSSEGCETDETLRPKYDIECEQGESMFYGLSRITKLKKGFDGEEDLQIHTSKMTVANWMFFNMKMLLELPVLDFSRVVKSAGAFYGCNSLRKLHLIVSENTVFDDVRVGAPSTFCGCSSLTDLTIEGIIGNDVNFSDCTELSGETVYKQIVTNLKDYSGTGITHTLILGSTLIAKVTDYRNDAIQEAVRKGWVVV